MYENDPGQDINRARVEEIKGKLEMLFNKTEQKELSYAPEF